MTPPLAPNGGELVKRLRQQDLSSEMSAEFFDNADWQGGYDSMVQAGREAADHIEALARELADEEGVNKILTSALGSRNDAITSAELTVTALRERLEGMEAALRGLLQHACIADAAPEDVDEEDRALERAARAILAKGPGQ